MSNVTEDTDLVTQLTDKSDAAHTHPGGSGDMEKATYDPANKNAQLAALTDLATDTNLSAAAQDAITKKHANTLDHAQNAYTDLDTTFEASLKNADNHTSGTTNKVFTATEQTKLAGIEAGAEVNNISDVNATDLTDGGQTTLHTHPGGSEAFPVGSVFLAVVATNPATLLGYGTWSAIAAGRVLVGLDSGDTDFDTAEETGGAKTINLAHTNDAHTAGRKGGTTNPQDIFNAPVTHASNLSATQSVVQPYFVVYMWKRTA